MDSDNFGNRDVRKGIHLSNVERIDYVVVITNDDVKPESE